MEYAYIDQLVYHYDSDDLEKMSRKAWSGAEKTEMVHKVFNAESNVKSHKCTFSQRMVVYSDYSTLAML